MKKIFFSLLLLLSLKSFASDVVPANTIIDLELMNKDVWAEASFLTAEEAALQAAEDVERAPASFADSEHLEIVQNSSQYLDVLKVIPNSLPSITRAAMEYKILNQE